jgi:hypothetical protein
LKSKQELKLQFLWQQRGVQWNLALYKWLVASAKFDLTSPVLTRMWLRIGSLKNQVVTPAHCINSNPVSLLGTEDTKFQQMQTRAWSRVMKM